MSTNDHLIRRRHALAVLTAALAGCKTGTAPAVGSEPTCTPSQATVRRSTHLLVDDQTTKWSESQSRKLVEMIVEWPEDADRVQLLGFGGRIADWGGTGAVVDISGSARGPTASQRLRYSPNDIRRMQNCTAQSRAVLRKAIEASLGARDTANDGQSPIFEAVARISQNWRSTGAAGLSVICLLSDGEQHSKAVSFAGAGMLLNPGDLVEQLSRRGLRADLRGVSVVHLGLGLGEFAPVSQPSKLHTLEMLWRGYWKATGANLLALSTPLPLDQLPKPRQTPGALNKGRDAE